MRKRLCSAGAGPRERWSICDVRRVACAIVFAEKLWIWLAESLQEAVRVLRWRRTPLPFQLREWRRGPKLVVLASRGEIFSSSTRSSVSASIAESSEMRRGRPRVSSRSSGLSMGIACLVLLFFLYNDTVESLRSWGWSEPRVTRQRSSSPCPPLTTLCCLFNRGRYQCCHLGINPIFTPYHDFAQYFYDISCSINITLRFTWFVFHKNKPVGAAVTRTSPKKKHNRYYRFFPLF